MLLPMSPTSSMFLLGETREHPMHVGGLQLFQPPDGADALDVRAMFEAAVADGDVAPLFSKRARRALTTFGQWGWEPDRSFDLEHHVRFNALPRPGRVLELLALCSRLHSSLLDRHRPLWEMHLIEGLEDGRYATYFKVHHSMVDGVSALRLMQRMLSEDPDERHMPAPWALRSPAPRRADGVDVAQLPGALARGALELAGATPAILRLLNRSLSGHDEVVAAAPKSMFNVPITGARRFAGQSWSIDRIRRISKAGEATLNDTVLAMCSGALRSYLLELGALPDVPLIAMVPVSLHTSESSAEGDGGGNAIGAVLCNLGTHLDDAGERLRTVHASMQRGKESLQGMSQLQILAVSAVAMSPVVLEWLLRAHGRMRPVFNLIISNVPGPHSQLYWNGARLDGVYPLSVPIDGQALNITCTSYADELAFGLTGCRRTVPHLQRLLTFLDDELAALERATGVA
ncbi:wax ester/triacylglycerol synthase family O-acyltransferase [Jatrophihabitans cynanchi]|jgi:diacylglycerol O-acyltransferase|uniref:Diacylglycerol O-acyltransferase n=1 Tax=Jatrophihabitans cynanchi TaxID=2944128 RepID=A0ABY7JYJ7_9ACTN|nr:wax ester/triacylglycerol synthase family O-acyltransferase [Jatrophihabitans sp. SB3-54]WAX57065.1 wax ester/triacylglycerol synthase family O-acyltransferase [Jatrophihabitans sp. SB3-54]